VHRFEPQVVPSARSDVQLVHFAPTTQTKERRHAGIFSPAGYPD